MFFPLLAKSGAASKPQMRRVSFEFCEKDVLFVIDATICNGKIKGLAILMYINTLLNLHKENAHVFFPLLAKSGAASIAQMRRVSFEFFEKVYCF